LERFGKFERFGVERFGKLERFDKLGRFPRLGMLGMLERLAMLGMFPRLERLERLGRLGRLGRLEGTRLELFVEERRLVLKRSGRSGGVFKVKEPPKEEEEGRKLNFSLKSKIGMFNK
jgi:hypothetical protein